MEAPNFSDLEVLRYYSLERLESEAHSSDIWAFGCLIIMILSGRDPHHNIKTAYGIVRAIKAVQWPYKEIDCHYPPLWSIAMSCWTKNPCSSTAASELALQMNGVRAGLLRKGREVDGTRLPPDTVRAVGKPRRAGGNRLLRRVP
ncbi:hypothetical protein BDV93DRAFT_566481 [Ceratobasidium sp. AG-I]|nr:hypothetical protein BDV93DRAFT_566481 [Ceratobasidium sp. AG-I]